MSERIKPSVLRVSGAWRFCALILLTATAIACSSIPIVSRPERRTYSGASYQSAHPFFFWGMVNAGSDPDVRRVCLGKGADQLETSYTFDNVLAWFFTLGIYSPRTIRIWCKL